MPVLLRDVAAAAGVAVSTASRALRGDLRISDPTRRRVAAAAARLGYRPDPLLGALASYRERNRPRVGRETIVLISTWPAGQGHRSPPRALPERCAALGYRFEQLTLGTDPAAQRAAGERLVARGVRGLLLGTGLVQQDELDLPWQEFACISVSGAPAMRLFPSVTSNYAQNLRQVMLQLRDRGYRRPGLVLDHWLMAATREACLTGWGHAFALGRARPAPPLVLGDAGGGERLARWVARERLDAVIAFSTGLRQVLVGAGLAVPGRLGFAALDAAPRAGVAGILQPREACHLVALDLLAARLRQHDYGPVDHPYAIQLEGVWIDGPTVRGPMRATDCTSRPGRPPAALP
jgi:LacI family transcriptional regulator